MAARKKIQNKLGNDPKYQAATSLRDELPRLRQRGFQRVRLNGEIRSLDEPNLIAAGAGTREITVELVLDRLVDTADQHSRMAD